ncbi:histidine phosphatase superfamily (branch 1) [Antarctobacter heliothermus]|uniref:Histidine phosphatase superfamily (Branch 1) n=1 Tax=Antarctobacter heliothermus TaxID=74033 RepID=A0A222EB19_9RHOB|nr:histidine phosphatase family protein [Antarctobacter heliothermus]ASP23161.1 histidine phosphatase superfamily (branch 1) [Antarctobacter heliothermus]
MIRRHILIALVSLTTASCALIPGTHAISPNSTVIVTRHGDRDGEDLSDKGRARAQALVTAVEGLGVKHIYSPGIQRNLDTAAPLAQATGLPVKRLPQENPTPALVERGAGTVVLWVGNKGNIASIWETLGLSEPLPLSYGDLHIIRTDSAGQVTIERRRYGPV